MKTLTPVQIEELATEYKSRVWMWAREILDKVADPGKKTG